MVLFCFIFHDTKGSNSSHSRPKILTLIRNLEKSRLTTFIQDYASRIIRKAGKKTKLLKSVHAALLKCAQKKNNKIHTISLQYIAVCFAQLLCEIIQATNSTDQMEKKKEQRLTFLLSTLFWNLAFHGNEIKWLRYFSLFSYSFVLPFRFYERKKRESVYFLGPGSSEAALNFADTINAFAFLWLKFMGRMNSIRPFRSCITCSRNKVKKIISTQSTIVDCWIS